MEILVAQGPASVRAILYTAFQLSWCGRNQLTFERVHYIHRLCQRLPRRVYRRLFQLQLDQGVPVSRNVA